MIDEFLKKYGLKYENLNSAERETLNNWLASLRKGQLTVERIKEYIQAMRDQVSQELENEPEYIQVFIFRWQNPKNQYLKARLKNYRLLQAFLEAPKKAEEALKRALEGFKK